MRLSRVSNSRPAHRAEELQTNLTQGQLDRAIAILQRPTVVTPSPTSAGRNCAPAGEMSLRLVLLLHLISTQGSPPSNVRSARSDCARFARNVRRLAGRNVGERCENPHTRTTRQYAQRLTGSARDSGGISLMVIPPNPTRSRMAWAEGPPVPVNFSPTRWFE